MATGEELEIPMPAMAPSYRVAPRRAQSMDPATRRLAVFAGVIGGSLLLLVGVWSFTGHRHNGVPVIEAASGPLRVKPANPGGLQVDGANDTILSGGNDGKQSAAPLPESPAPQALKAEEQAAAPPPPKVASAPEAAQAAPPQPQPEASAPAARTDLQPLPPLRPHMNPATTTTTTAAKPATPPAPPAKQAAPAATPPTKLAAVSAAPASAASTVPPKVATGAALVQLAAVQSEEAAMSEWQRLSHKYPDLLGGRRPTISKTEHGGKTYYRLRTGGFSDVAQAAVFCERVKSQGGGCAIASF